jgi:mono/diheme cytochrome c family protein
MPVNKPRARCLRRIKAALPNGPQGAQKEIDMLFKGAVLFLAGSLLWSTAASAQDIDDGHRLAARWCSACHAVEAVVQGPVQDAAPSFLSIARMPSATQMSLTAFLMTPHPTMPNFSLTRAEIRNVVAYILSLQEGDSQFIKTGIPRPAPRPSP